MFIANDKQNSTNNYFILFTRVLRQFRMHKRTR